MKENKDIHNYKTFDQEISIEKAQKLVEQLKKKKKNLLSIKIDSNTIIQINPKRTNPEQVIKRIKNKQKNITLIDEIEYGNYA